MGISIHPIHLSKPIAFALLSSSIHALSSRATNTCAVNSYTSCVLKEKFWVQKAYYYFFLLGYQNCFLCIYKTSVDILIRRDVVTLSIFTSTNIEGLESNQKVLIKIGKLTVLGTRLAL